MSHKDREQDKPLTIHTSRTIMSAELIDVLNYPKNGSGYNEVMEKNVFNKRTESSRKKTIRYLTQLYGFDKQDIRFKALEDYWQRSDEEDKIMLTFLYAVSKDYLLKESVSFVKAVAMNEKAHINGFEDNITDNHPNQFSAKTLRSAAQNIASSWKQAGYIEGKVKNLRVKRSPSYALVSFAFLMAYLDGARGEYMTNHPSVRALDVSKEEMNQLIKAAADRDLVRYNKSGTTIVISFENYINRIENGKS